MKDGPDAVTGFGSGCSDEGSQFDFGPIDVELFSKSAAFPIHNSQTKHSTQIGRSACRPSVTSTSESKRSSNATSLNTSHISKRQKVDGAPSADLSMLQCASYALEMLSHGGLWSHVISALMTDDTIQLSYFDCSIILVSRPVNFLTFCHYVAGDYQYVTTAMRLRGTTQTCTLLGQPTPNH